MKKFDSNAASVRNKCRVLTLSAALLAGTAIQAQTNARQEAAEAEQTLLASTQSRTAVDATDKALLETALGSPEFAERLKTIPEPVYVMMHGIEFEPISDLQAGGKNIVLLNKAGLNGKNPDAFFIIREFQRTAHLAYVDLVLESAPEGGPKEITGSEFMFARNGERWEKQVLKSKVIR